MKQAFFYLIVCGLLAGCGTLGHHAPPAFNVFFHKGGTELTPEAAQIVDAAAVSIREGHPGTVVISAGTAPGDNMQSVEKRAAIVQAELVAKGVDPAILARASFVESETELGAAADRRVEIKLLADKTP